MNPMFPNRWLNTWRRSADGLDQPASNHSSNIKVSQKWTNSPRHLTVSGHHAGFQLKDAASGGFEWTARNTVCDIETDGLIPEMTKVHILLVRDGHAESSRIASRNIPNWFGVPAA